MNVGTICKRNVVTVAPTDDLTTAAQLMRERHVGYLIVTEPGIEPGKQRPVGVLTDRDIVVAVLAPGADVNALRVDDVMSRDPEVAQDTDSIAEALATMRRVGVRRLPIVSVRGDLVGVLSLDDILDSLAEQLQDLAGSIRTEQAVESVVRT